MKVFGGPHPRAQSDEASLEMWRDASTTMTRTMCTPLSFCSVGRALRWRSATDVATLRSIAGGDSGSVAGGSSGVQAAVGGPQCLGDRCKRARTHPGGP